MYDTRDMENWSELSVSLDDVDSISSRCTKWMDALHGVLFVW